MSLTNLPKNLPVPQDDGAADHLLGMTLPDISLLGTDDKVHHLNAFKRYLVIYIYPMTGRPDVPLPDGWEAIPGARGCTPQSCRFRDHYADLQQHSAQVVGLSTQSTAYQQEAKARLHLPYELLSDTKLQFKHALSLPTFSVETMELYKRLTLIAQDGEIVKVFYPVFPPDQNAADVLAWLEER
ncbi:MAG: peroxiredoxin [Deinococcota bacterium]